MKNPMAFNLVMISLAVGFGSACGAIDTFLVRLSMIWNRPGAEDMADISIRALRLARAGNTNLIPFLEEKLDDSILSLGKLVSSTPASQREQYARNDLSMLQKARTCRAEFPHKGDAAIVDEHVSEAFALLNEKR